MVDNNKIMSDQISIEFVESEMRIFLEIMTDKKKAMEKFYYNSDDEDKKSEVGNDLIELNLLLNKIRDIAVKKWGEDILDFNYELL